MSSFEDLREEREMMINDQMKVLDEIDKITRMFLNKLKVVFELQDHILLKVKDYLDHPVDDNDKLHIMQLFKELDLLNNKYNNCLAS